MKVETVKADRVRVWLSEKEMEQWGLSEAMTPGGCPAADRHIRRLIATVRRFTGHAFPQVVAEVLPVEGGCVLLLSAPERDTADAPYSCVIADADALLSLAGQWQYVHTPLTSFLYELEGGYLLALYPADRLTRAQTALLAEYGTLRSNDTGGIAYAAEHGDLLAADDALERLALKAPAPVPPAPPEPQT